MKNFFILSIVALLLTCCQRSLEEQAALALKAYTEKNCPIQMGEAIIMDSCRFEAESHTMHYFYRFLGALDNDSTQDAATMRNLLLNALKNETTSRIYKEAGYSFQYTYFSDSHPDKVLFDALFTKEDYQ